MIHIEKSPHFYPGVMFQTSCPKGNDRSSESQHVQKGFFFLNNLGQDAQNKYAQGQVTPK